MNYTAEQFEELLQAIYEGDVNPRKLPNDLVFATNDYLIKGVAKGYIPNLKVKADALKQKAIEESIFLFTGAKTFQYVISCKNLLNKKESLEQFKDKIRPTIQQQFYETWLDTEYNTAQLQGYNVRDNQNIEEEADLFPYLLYDAVNDINTSEKCKAKDGLVIRVDNPIRQNISPCTHYNCRCEWRQLSQTQFERKGLKLSNLDKIQKNDRGFLNSDMIFDKSHPYFDVPPIYEKFKNKNFGILQN